MNGRVLIVAGSDSGGGAGIQADLKTALALGAYAMTAIAALTAQSTESVAAIHDVPADFVALQMRLALDDIGADAIKTGMLSRAETVIAVADAIAACAPAAVPLVVDPVMIAKGGHPLLDSTAAHALAERLLPMAAVVTPNAPEAEALSGFAVRDAAGAEHAARAIRECGARAVLIKGGHLDPDAAIVRDFLLDADGRFETFEAPRLQTRHTHGTGCTLATAIACGLAQEMTLRASVVRARAFVRRAIAAAPGFGRGHGPLDHGHAVGEYPAEEE